MEQPAGYKIAVFTSSPATFIETHFSLAYWRGSFVSESIQHPKREKPKHPKPEENQKSESLKKSVLNPKYPLEKYPILKKAKASIS
jgi:hypothetical protein